MKKTILILLCLVGVAQAAGVTNVPVPYPAFTINRQTRLQNRLQTRAVRPVTITYDTTDSSAVRLAGGLADALNDAGWQVTGPTAAGGINPGIHITSTTDMDNGSRALWEFLNEMEQPFEICDSHQPIKIYPADWTPMAGTANLVGIAIGATPVTCSQRGPGQS